MSLSCDEESPFTKSIENTKAPSLAEELDFEYDTASSGEKATAGISDVVGTDFKATDEGDDIEEGEIVDGKPKRPCRFYQRGECAFGKFCSFLHLNDKGLYNMFDSGPTLPHSPIRFREPVEYSREFVFEAVDTSWERTLREAMNRVKQWDLVRQRKAPGKVVEKVQCDSKLDVYTCEPPARKSPPPVRKSPPPVRKSPPPVRKSSPPDTLEETSKSKPTASDPVNRHNFHSAWRDPWRRSPGRKILPSPPTSESCSSRSRSSSSSPSRRGTRSGRRRKNRRLPSDESSCLSDSSSDSTSPERKRRSRSKSRRRVSWICKARHRRSTSSCRSWSLPRKRTPRSERHYRNRRSSTSKTRRRRSTSSSRLSSPRVLAAVARSVRKRIEKELPSRRERIRSDAKPTSPRGNAKASPVKRFPKNLEVGRKKVDAKSVGRQRGGTLGDKRSAEGTRGSLDSHWTPKKVKSESCSDMSISPLSSPLIEMCPRKNDRTSPVCLSSNEDASGGVPKRVCSPKPPRRPKSGLEGGPAPDGKRGRKKMDPLEMELMKCNKNFASARTCEDFEKPRPTKAQNGTRAKSKKTVKKENAKLPSRKEILLKRLEAINAAIARKTKRST